MMNQKKLTCLFIMLGVCLGSLWIGASLPAMAKKKANHEAVSRDVRVMSLEGTSPSQKDSDNPATLLLQLKTTSPETQKQAEEAFEEATRTEDLGYGLWLVRFPLKLYSQASQTADHIIFSQNKQQQVGYSSPDAPSWQPLGMVREYFEFVSEKSSLYALRVLDEDPQDPQWIKVQTPFALTTAQDTAHPTPQTQHTAWLYIPEQQIAKAPVRSNHTNISLTQHHGKVLGLWDTASMVGWADFMRETTKLHGYYWRAGTPAHLKSILTRPEDDAPVVPMKALKDVKVLHARGGWLMVEARDIMATGWQIGWIRWRDDAGRLLIYPDF
jgi:hypothetical protein